MAGSVNKVILLGNVGKDPEVRLSADGKKMLYEWKVVGNIHQNSELLKGDKK